MRPALAILCIGFGASAAPASLDGAWSGKLQVGAIALRLVFHLQKSGSGYSATCDSVDQGANGLPVDRVTVEGDRVTLEMAKLGAVYRATLAAGRDKMSGTFTQHGASFPLELARGALEPPKRPQEPKAPLPYDAVDVIVDGPNGIKLAGTFTHPRGAARVPAVALVTGSGPEDRDETVFGHKPFWILADALTRRGIAVLRWDDRGVGKSTGDFAKATTFDFVDDALAATAWLRARPEVDARRVGLIGHSEGGLVAPIAASRNMDIAFIVLLAGPGIPGDEILLLQGERLLRAQGKSDADVARWRKVESALLDIAKREKDEAAAKKAFRALAASLPPAERADWPSEGTSFDAFTAQLTSPWFKTFLTLDPKPYLSKVRCPVLALNGERDLQVPPTENLQAIQSALKANSRVKTQQLPGLNHLFQHCKTGLPEEYASIEETFSPDALQLIADWIVGL